jgi:hypothetical protein
MANEAEGPQRALPREFRRERVHEDFKASYETARAAAQAAILINGGAATAILAFLLYAIGVACGALSIWYSAQAAAWFASSALGNLTDDPGAANDLEKGRNLLERHKGLFPASIVLFLAASFWIALKLS